MITQTLTGNPKSEVMRVGGASWGTWGDLGGEPGATESNRSSHVCFQPRKPNDTDDSNTIIERLIVCRNDRVWREFDDSVANVWTATGGE